MHSAAASSSVWQPPGVTAFVGGRGDGGLAGFVGGRGVGGDTATVGGESVGGDPVGGASVGATGSGVGEAGASVGETGLGVGDTGFGVGETGIGVGETGASVGVTGAGVGEAGAAVAEGEAPDGGRGLGAEGKLSCVSCNNRSQNLSKFSLTISSFGNEASLSLSSRRCPPRRRLGSTSFESTVAASAPSKTRMMD